MNVAVATKMPYLELAKKNSASGPRSKASLRNGLSCGFAVWVSVMVPVCNSDRSICHARPPGLAKVLGSQGLVGGIGVDLGISYVSERLASWSLHANATTAPKVRADSQRSRKPVVDLAAELGVSETAI